MPAPASLHEIQQRADAQFMIYGPTTAQPPIEIVETFGEFPAEYAAIRQRVGIMHLPHLGLLRLTGFDRADLLHRLLTQDIKGMAHGQSRRAFQLNDKGRIVADVIVHHGDADTWLQTDRLDLTALRTLLESKIFTEDVTIEDFSPQRTIFALHGPAAWPLLQALTDGPTHAAPLHPGHHTVMALAGVPVTISRRDICAVTGLDLFVPSEEATDLYQKLLDAAGFDPQADIDATFAEKRRGGLRGRPIGWRAFNTARIEAGSPLFHVDFATDSLPAETGILDQAVSFTKGCYLGQEIVARMKNLGHPKRILVGLKIAGDALPVAGAQVLEALDPQTPSAQGQPIGGITSSTLAPMLGNTPIAFAVLKWGKHAPGTAVDIVAEGYPVRAVVQGLNFLSTQ